MADLIQKICDGCELTAAYVPDPLASPSASAETPVAGGMTPTAGEGFGNFLTVSSNPTPTKKRVIYDATIAKDVNRYFGDFFDVHSNEYSNLRIIGQGGFGIAFAVKNEVLDREEVFKVAISPDEKGGDPNPAVNEYVKERFKAEVQLTGALTRSSEGANHRIVRAHDARYSPTGYFYLVTEFCSGQTLDVYRNLLKDLADIGDSTDLSLSAKATQLTRGLKEELVEVFRQYAETLNYSHQKGVVHCDIKGSNLIAETSITGELDRIKASGGLRSDLEANLDKLALAMLENRKRSPDITERVKGRIIDFGIADVVEKSEFHGKGMPAHLVKHDFRIGTTGVMPIEQLCPRRYGQPTPQTDIALLGATMMEVLEGVPVYDRPSGEEQKDRDVYFAATHGNDADSEAALKVLLVRKYVDVSTRPLQDKITSSISEACLARLPKDRPSSMAEVARNFAALQAGDIADLHANTLTTSDRVAYELACPLLQKRKHEENRRRWSRTFSWSGLTVALGIAVASFTSYFQERTRRIDLGNKTVLKDSNHAQQAAIAQMVEVRPNNTTVGVSPKAKRLSKAVEVLRTNLELMQRDHSDSYAMKDIALNGSRLVVAQSRLDFENNFCAALDRHIDKDTARVIPKPFKKEKLTSALRVYLPEWPDFEDLSDNAHSKRMNCLRLLPLVLAKQVESFAADSDKVKNFQIDLLDEFTTIMLLQVCERCDTPNIGIFSDTGKNSLSLQHAKSADQIDEELKAILGCYSYFNFQPLSHLDYFAKRFDTIINHPEEIGAFQEKANREAPPTEYRHLRACSLVNTHWWALSPTTRAVQSGLLERVIKSAPEDFIAVSCAAITQFASLPSDRTNEFASSQAVRLADQVLHLNPGDLGLRLVAGLEAERLASLDRDNRISIRGQCYEDLKFLYAHLKENPQEVLELFSPELVNRSLVVLAETANRLGDLRLCVEIPNYVQKTTGREFLITSTRLIAVSATSRLALGDFSAMREAVNVSRDITLLDNRYLCNISADILATNDKLIKKGDKGLDEKTLDVAVANLDAVISNGDAVFQNHVISLCRKYHETLNQINSGRALISRLRDLRKS